MPDVPQSEEVPRSGENLEIRVARLEERLKSETRLRETVMRSDKLALDKAEKFITEKSAQHNDILGKMERMTSTFVTKDGFKKDILFYLSISSGVVLLISFLMRFYIK